MTKQVNYKKRFHLSLIAQQTQRFLLFFLLGIVVILFFIYLFLMNHLAMRGIVLSREMTATITLNREIEQVEARLANIQTNEFLVKSSMVSMLIPKKNSFFVTIPAIKYTAQK
jgi:hypothetical protein